MSIFRAHGIMFAYVLSSYIIFVTARFDILFGCSFLLGLGQVRGYKIGELPMGVQFCRVC